MRIVTPVGIIRRHYRIGAAVIAALGIAFLGSWKLDEYLYWQRDAGMEVNPSDPARKLELYRPSFHGRPALDFELPDVKSKALVSLKTLCRTRPVVIILGSFTCDVFCEQIESIQKLRKAHKDDVEFVFVYIREAPHLSPALDEFRAAHPEFPDPISAGLAMYEFDFPCVIDADHRIEEHYQAYPLRMLIVNSQENVEWDSRPGLKPSRLNVAEADVVLQKYNHKKS